MVRGALRVDPFVAVRGAALSSAKTLLYLSKKMGMLLWGREPRQLTWEPNLKRCLERHGFEG